VLPNCCKNKHQTSTAPNVKGVFLLLQQCLPLLADGAGVVLISSIAHFKVLPGHTVYAATKAALRSLARGFAAELAPRQIRVNCLSPGPVRTPILHKLGVDASALDQLEQQIAGQIPLRRLGEPAEIARAAVFLAGPDASFINGVDLCVDGGMSQL
jgi:NAD(P)-dependent dehydrogenase (short-subunit alcohol dehydrogenase family)